MYGFNTLNRKLSFVLYIVSFNKYPAFLDSRGKFGPTLWLCESSNSQFTNFVQKTQKSMLKRIVWVLKTKHET
jgi:hypothetical protein